MTRVLFRQIEACLRLENAGIYLVPGANFFDLSEQLRRPWGADILGLVWLANVVDLNQFLFDGQIKIIL